MKKIDLYGLSILIPLRIDSLDRLENLMYLLNYLNKYFNVEVNVLHADKIQKKCFGTLISDKCNYIFVEDIDPIFHRTHYINQLFDLTNNPIIAIWDADVLVSPDQIQFSLNSILNNNCEVCFPYDGTFYNVDAILKDCFQKASFEIGFLQRNKAKMNVLYDSVQNGGVFFVSREAFFNAKLEDENFYGWGPEDWNRVEKWKVLRYRVKRANGPLFHLHHSRDINGNYNSLMQRKRCHSILATTQLSSPELLSNAPHNKKISTYHTKEALINILR